MDDEKFLGEPIGFEREMESRWVFSEFSVSSFCAFQRTPHDDREKRPIKVREEKKKKKKKLFVELASQNALLRLLLRCPRVLLLLLSPRPVVS